MTNLREMPDAKMDRPPNAVYRFGNLRCDFTHRTYLMGILNVTPDSFSDGGRFFDIEKAVAHARQLERDGADFLDVGGESSRPGAQPVTADEEIRRVIPVVKRLAKDLSIPISIDTTKSIVAREALRSGAVIVNDISALRFDAAMPKVIADHSATAVLMHMKGEPRSMQQNPRYDDVVGEVSSFLQQQAIVAERAGITQIILDPGIGFGKDLSHNIALIRHLRAFLELGYPVMVGPSRKSFIGALLDLPVEDRIEGTAAAVTASVLGGASIVRVHDVKEMKRVVRVADSIALRT
jgi:dihydropteroate synthase